MVREGILRAMESCPDITVVAEVSTARELMDSVSAKVDCVVTETDLPDRDGLLLLEELHRLWPKLPVVAYSTVRTEAFVIRCLGAGAFAYLGKDSNTKELVSAIRSALAGEKYLTPTLAARVATELGSTTAHRPPLLMSMALMP